MWKLVEPQLLRMEPCGTSTFKSEAFMWNLVKPELLTVEPLCVEPCGTWTFNFYQWNLYVEPCGTWTVNSGTFMWNLVEPEHLTVAPCGTSTFNSGTFMWNMMEPELLRMEPVSRSSHNLVLGFSHPKLDWKNPKLFKLLEKTQTNECCTPLFRIQKIISFFPLAARNSKLQSALWQLWQLN